MWSLGVLLYSLLFHKAPSGSDYVSSSAAGQDEVSESTPAEPGIHEHLCRSVKVSFCQGVYAMQADCAVQLLLMAGLSKCPCCWLACRSNAHSGPLLCFPLFEHPGSS